MRKGEHPDPIVNVLAALTLIVASGCGHRGSTDAITPATDLAKPIDEKRFVPIGGIDQWITIKGKHRGNPIVLFLHGGPGNAWSPFADQVFDGEWTERFTIVQWDQRGSGRTYSKTGPSIASTMTIERMVQDSIEVTQLLERELHQPKIIVTGGSWGSVLGVLAVKARPELYCAYVGVAQIIDINKNLAASYPRVLEAARAVGNAKAIEELTVIGPPPWSKVQSLGTNMRWARVLEPQPPQAFEVGMSGDYTENEIADSAAAADMSQLQLFGPTLAGPIMQVDLPALGMKFDVPVVMIQGGGDLKAIPEVSKAYFDRIEAPYKQFVIEPGTGHEPSKALLELWRKALDETVRPRCAR